MTEHTTSLDGLVIKITSLVRFSSNLLLNRKYLSKMNLACFENVPSQDFQDHFKITRLTELSLKLFDPLEFVKHIDSKNKTS